MFKSIAVTNNDENGTFSANAKIDQVALLSCIEANMTTSNKHSCTPDVVFDFTRDLAQVIESGLQKNKTLPSHLNYIRETMHVVRANKKQPFVCGWSGVRLALESSLTTTINTNKKDNFSIDYSYS